VSGLVLHKFDGDAHGEDDEWEAHIQIEVRTEDDKKALPATVTVRWSGSESGQTVFSADKNGKIDVRIGEFDSSSLTFEIAAIELEGYLYMPSLNEVSDTIVIGAR
jgi:hypothetical protein